MASNFAYITSADYKYIPELCAELNSLDYVGNRFDLHLIGVHLPEEFTSQFDKLNYRVIHHNISEEEIEESRGITEITCRKRYWYAGELKDYASICILDADMVFVRNPWQFFEIATKTGFILGVSKEQNKVYDHDHHLVDDEWIWNFERGFYNDKDICNCPIFLDARIWEKPLKFSWEIFLNRSFRAPDMDAINMSLLQFGGYEKIIKLPGIQWLGTNEQLLKPYIRAIETHGKIQTEFGIEVFSYHGQFYHDIWREQQLINRHQCAEGYLKASLCSDEMAKGALSLLTDYFFKMLDWKIRIEHHNYR